MNWVRFWLMGVIAAFVLFTMLCFIGLSQDGLHSDDGLSSCEKAEDVCLNSHIAVHVTAACLKLQECEKRGLI
jgi:hypothetical protein